MLPLRTNRRGAVAAILFAAVMLATLATRANAQVNDTYMRVDGVTGEATDDKHPGWIDLISFSQTIGTKACARIVVTKRLDSASPGLVTFAASNHIVPTIVVEILKPGADRQRVFRATLEQVLVGQSEIIEQDFQLLNERVVLLPRSVRLAYTPISPDGRPLGDIVSTVTCQ